MWEIFAFYQLVRRICDEERALASAAIMATLPGGIFIERSFLPDPAVVALITILTVGHVRLKGMYSRGWKQQPYELGMLLRQASQPEDLVVTMSSDLGDPNVIYYSQRRGWTFPPASNDIDWSQFPPEEDAIQMFESLREQSADWFAIAQRHNKNFKENYPQVAAHIEATCELYQTTQAGVIYRILPLREAVDR